MKENFLLAAPARLMRNIIINKFSPPQLWLLESLLRSWTVRFQHLPSGFARWTSSTSGILGPLWTSTPDRRTPRWSDKNPPKGGQQAVFSRPPGELPWEMDFLNAPEQMECVGDARSKGNTTKSHNAWLCVARRYLRVVFLVFRGERQQDLRVIIRRSMKCRRFKATYLAC